MSGSAPIWRAVLRNVPLWRIRRFARFREILEPHATTNCVAVRGQRARVEVWDISDGCILWLPPKTHIADDALLAGLKSQRPELFDHRICKRWRETAA